LEQQDCRVAHCCWWWCGYYYIFGIFLTRNQTTDIITGSDHSLKKDLKIDIGKLHTLVEYLDIYIEDNRKCFLRCIDYLGHRCQCSSPNHTLCNRSHYSPHTLWKVHSLVDRWVCWGWHKQRSLSHEHTSNLKYWCMWIYSMRHSRHEHYLCRRMLSSPFRSCFDYTVKNREKFGWVRLKWWSMRDN
jgi:hypothetical protein